MSPYNIVHFTHAGIQFRFSRQHNIQFRCLARAEDLIRFPLSVSSFGILGENMKIWDKRRYVLLVSQSPLKVQSSIYDEMLIFVGKYN